MRAPWLAPLIKLTIYTTIIAVLTTVLALVIVNARSAPSYTYRALFADASGVRSNNNVKIAGVSIGRVNGVKVVGHGTAEVTFSVDKDVALPQNVRAVVRYENLVGDRYIELERPAAPEGRLKPETTIPLDHTAPAVNLTVLFGGFQPLFQALDPSQVNQLADEILRTLQGEGGTVQALLTHTASLTSTLADRDAVIGSLITHLNEVLGTVADRDQNLSALLTQLQTFVTGLSRNRKVIGSAVSSMGALSRSVAGLLQDARPPLKNDISALGDLARVLNNGSDTIQAELEAIPGLMNTVDRTASYGSWFQFYLCNLGGAFTLPGSGLTKIQPYQNAEARCSQ